MNHPIVDIRQARLREFAERWPDPASAVARGTRATIESLPGVVAVTATGGWLQPNGMLGYDPRDKITFTEPPTTPRATVESMRPRMAVEEEQERIAEIAARIIQESGDPRTVVHFVGPPILLPPPAFRSRLLALAVALSLALWAVVIWAALR